MNLTQRLIAGLIVLMALPALPALFVLNGAAPHTLLVVGALALVTAIGIALLTAITVMGPLRRTAQQMRVLGTGDWGQRLEWTADDSLGQIASEVNRMAVRLRELQESAFGRKQMEQQLSDAVVQSMYEPVIVTNARGQVLKLNAAAEQVLGQATETMELAKTPAGEKILKAVRDAVSMQRAVAHEGDAALLPISIGQAERSYRLRTTPIRDNDGKLLGAVSVLEDVTELQDLDRFKSRFIAVASDRLRSPLEHLRLALYSLSRGFAGELRPLQVDLLQGAEEEAEHLDDLMTDLIDVAELDTGSRALHMERLRPIDILRDAALRFQEEAYRRGIQIQIEAFSDLSPVHGDRRALRSVMDNLLANALRFTPPKGTITLEAEEVKKRIQFFVRDTGSGIEPERLKRIFGRFAQGARSAEEVRGAVGSAGLEGTGLGLALVRRLIELMHGQVAIESRVGQGTTFSFMLPLAPIRMTRHMIEVG